MDNLNTHGISSLYEAFDPETAFRLAKRLEIHYTPKHGSWLERRRDRTVRNDKRLFRKKISGHRPPFNRAICLGIGPKCQSSQR
jgi:hypothetical protein